MKQLLNISKSILAMAFFAALILAGCRSGVKNAGKDADSLKVTGANASVYEDIRQARRFSIHYLLLSNLQCL